MGKQNPELAKILNSTDTLSSAWSKYQLVLKGVTVDIKSMSGEAASAALVIANTISQTTASVLKNDPALIKQYSKYDTLTAKIKNLITASKGQTVKQQIDTKARIKSINEEIDAINKAADEKIKALRKTNEAENSKISIQKAQLDYQSAIARGDRDAAAQAQLTIQQITNDAQQKAAEDKISTNAEKQIVPLKAELDKINNAQDAIGNKAALAGESLGKLQSEAATLKGNLEGLNTALSTILLNRALDPKYSGSQQEKDDLAAADAAKLKLGIKPVLPKREGDVAAKYAAEVNNSMLTSISSALEKGITAKQINIYADAVKTYDKSSTVAPTVTATKTDPNVTRQASTTEYSVSATTLAGMGISFGIGTKFKGSDKKEYIITALPNQAGLSKVKPTGKAKGGSVLGSTPYIVGEKGPELFVPGMSGTIIPNNITGPRFNIPTGNITGMSGGNTNGSSNSNMYNINIELNGTNVTADDIMRKFKQELSLINAKEGPSRTFGGRP